MPPGGLSTPAVAGSIPAGGAREVFERGNQPPAGTPGESPARGEGSNPSRRPESSPGSGRPGAGENLLKEEERRPSKK